MSGNYITSFIGFMPADDPQVIVYIAVDNAKGITQFGGTIAAPIAKSVLESCISILNIQKRENEIEREYMYLDKQYAQVPNVVGMSIKEALTYLKKFKVEYSGSGEVITYQSINPNEYVYEGETIRLLLN